jgi:signal transduction histidine kinase
MTIGLYDERVTRARAFSVMGMVLGLGAPLGLLAVRRLRSPVGSLRRWVVPELRSQGETYAYVAGATSMAFGSFGALLGHHEDRLIASQRELDRLREEFAAVIAHDLRSPIQTLQLQTDRLLEEVTGDEVRVPSEAVRRLRRSAARLAGMVGDLLDASRLEASRLVLNPRRVSAGTAITEVIDRIRPLLGDHPVSMEVVGAPPEIDADPGRLDQILTNLLENAAKYSGPAAPIRVRVEAEGEGTSISVADQGIGIADDEMPRLFDRFYQAKRARKKKSGLGLGLYITKGLVEAHRGRISVESALGRGSTFHVWLRPHLSSGHAARD